MMLYDGCNNDERNIVKGPVRGKLPTGTLMFCVPYHRPSPNVYQSLCTVYACFMFGYVDMRGVLSLIASAAMELDYVSRTQT